MAGTNSPTLPVVRVNVVTAPEAPSHPVVGSAEEGSPAGRHSTSVGCWDAVSTRGMKAKGRGQGSSPGSENFPTVF